MPPKTEPTGERAAELRSTATQDTVSPAALLNIVQRGVGKMSRVAVLLNWAMALRQRIGSFLDQRHRLEESPRLIAADAALLLVDRWRSELTVLRRRSPTSDAVKTLADCIEELSAAITAGHDATIQLTVAEAHALSHIPVSTLRWLCNRKSTLLGAHKREGIWYIDRTAFESYLASPDGQPVQQRDKTQEVSPVPERMVAFPREVRADVGAALL